MIRENDNQVLSSPASVAGQQGQAQAALGQNAANASVVSKPKAEFKPFEWLRENLFSSPFNSFLTLVVGWALFQSFSGLIEWGVLSAVWTGTADVCREASGACWAVIPEKYRFILFGVYPYDEHWRPVLATAMFMGLILLSCMKRFWRVEMLVVWALGLVVMGVLMWGGVLGMTYVENDRWGGLPLTLMLASLAIVLAFPLSVLLALGRQSDLPAIRAVCVGFIEIFRGVPLVSVLFMASVMFPLFLPEGVTIDKLLRALLGMALFTAAYLAEAIRGGLQAIPQGQYEAADAMGLSYWQKMLFIILPQALRLVIPPIVNQFISCFKDTSLVTIVGLFDLLTTAKVALSDPMWRPFFVESYAFTALIYWGFCFFMSRYSQWLEKDLNVGVRR